MTTYKGIAAVTQTLQYLTGAAAIGAVPEARITLSRPEESPAGAATEPRMNLYLVQVLPEPTMRAGDLPTRDDRGNLAKTPIAPVNLRYLLSFFGASEKAHLMLGAVEVALREHAVLDAELISQALSNSPALQDSGLEAQVPPVRVVPSMVSLEELSRFWSGFLQTPYTVSTVYEALTVVLSSPELPVATLPARQVATNLGATAPQLGPLPTVQFTTSSPGTVVPVAGARLAPGQLVEVGDVWVPLVAGPDGWQLTLPATVPAGAVTVRLGTVPTAAPGPAPPPAVPAPQPIPGSRPQVLRIRPELVSASAGPGGTSVTVELAPAVREGQEVVLSLVGTGAGVDPTSDSVQIPLTPVTTSASLTFPVPAGLASGQYLTIAELDGISTLPAVVGGTYAQPVVGVR